MMSTFLIFVVFLSSAVKHVSSQHAGVSTLSDDLVLIEDSLYFEVVWPESLMYTYRIRQARDFGIRFDKVYNKVPLVVTEPLEACEGIQNDVNGAVAFIIRGGCSFLTKARHAEEGGALAVVITDNDEQNDGHMIDMIQDDTDRYVNIPSLFLLGKDGAMIRRYLRFQNSDQAIINIPINMTGKPLTHTRRPPWTLW